MSLTAHRTIADLEAATPVADPRPSRPPIAAIVIVAAGGGAVAALASGVGAAVPILAMLLLIASAVLLIRPALGLPVALFLLWTDTAGVLNFYHGVSSSAAIVVPLALCLPLAAERLRGEPLRLDAGFGWMMAILLVEIAATLTSTYQDVGVARIEKFIQEGLIVYLLVVNVARTPGSLRSAMWAIIAAGTFLALFTVIQELAHRYDHTFFGFAQADHNYLQGKDTTARAQGPLADPNYYAQILLPSLVLAIVAMLRETTRLRRICAGIAAAVVVVALVFTYSRGAAAALALVLLLLMVLGYLRGRHLAAILAVVVALLIAFPSYGNRIASLTQVGGATAQVGSSNAADLSIQSRATENLAAWLAFRDHPLLGVGPSGFPLVYQSYAAKVGGAIHQASKHGQSAGEAPQRAAHELFLGIAAEQGALGVMVFTGLLFFTFSGLLRARRRWLRRDRQLETLAGAYLVALVSYIAAGVFLQLAFERYLWALIALCVATTGVLLRRELPLGDR